MHRLLAALAVGGLVLLTAPPVAAQTDPRACFAQTNQAAWNTLAQGYNYSPAGYGPFGWAPLAQAFDPALAGAPRYTARRRCRCRPTVPGAGAHVDGHHGRRHPFRGLRRERAGQPHAGRSAIAPAARAGHA